MLPDLLKTVASLYRVMCMSSAVLIYCWGCCAELHELCKRNQSRRGFEDLLRTDALTVRLGRLPDSGRDPFGGGLPAASTRNSVTTKRRKSVGRRE